MSTRCKTCGYDVLINLKHRCPPDYEVLDISYSSATALSADWKHCSEVYAYSHEAAAEKAAEEMDDGEAEGPSERVLLVRRRGDEHEVKTFNVGFDHYVSYTAYELEDDA